MPSAGSDRGPARAGPRRSLRRTTGHVRARRKQWNRQDQWNWRDRSAWESVAHHALRGGRWQAAEAPRVRLGEMPKAVHAVLDENIGHRPFRLRLQCTVHGLEPPFTDIAAGRRIE